MHTTAKCTTTSVCFLGNGLRDYLALGSLATGAYLAVMGYEKMASAVIGFTVMSVIGKIILQRLD